MPHRIGGLSNSGGEQPGNRTRPIMATDDFPEYKTVSVADLIPYARNSRTHSDAQVSKIAASIKEFGFLNPIIADGDNGIIAGHGRVLAAQKLGLATLPVIEAAHLTEAQRRAYVIADNRLALDAGWDNDLLKIELQDLEAAGFDLSLTGFEIEGMKQFFLEPDFAPGTEAGQGRLDQLEPKMCQCPNCGEQFDLREHGQG